MNVFELINHSNKQNNFSFEVLPPLKGSGTNKLFETIDKLKDYNPLFINITTHHSEYVYKELGNGLLQRSRIRRRPGTIAIAAAIQQKYNIPVIPHIICSGATKDDIEYELIDLQFLGINNVLLLRGDKAREDKNFTPIDNGYNHTTELIEQVAKFNEGEFIDGTKIRNKGEIFNFGVACYPEKHEEAPNLTTDITYLKQKQDLGATYAVTQLFYDNKKYFEFVKKAREMGITIPIIPGLKPFAKLSQLTIIPKTFHCDLPEELSREVMKCKSDDDAKTLGVEWCEYQCKDLIDNGVKNVHFYTVSAVDSVKDVVNKLF
ncbi:MAG: methylenetetrahydrofolate reductase [NAD(P)H] [Bacteroidaceae bacterium]|nr:methylenetetrahydrofolate reductase [NAD(P)H] [Bacteroidaceae bacterium]